MRVERKGREERVIVVNMMFQGGQGMMWAIVILGH